jgi:hypothetical protein
LKKIAVYIVISIIVVVIAVPSVLFLKNTHTTPINGVDESRKASIEKFQNTFCGLNTEVN